MADEWYYKSHGEVYGPLPFAGILDKGRSGELSLDDSIRQGLDGEWVSVESISALFLNLKPAGPPEVGDSPDAGADLEEYRDLSELDITSAEPPGFTEALDELVPSEEPVGAAWHARVLGSEMGPMPFADLKAMAEHGELGADDEVRSDDNTQWIPAGTVEGLFVETAVDTDAGSGQSESVLSLDGFQFVEKVSDAISEPEAAPEPAEPPASVESETHAPEQAAAIEQAPAVEQTRAIGQAPAVEQKAASEQTAAVEPDLDGGSASPPPETRVPVHDGPSGWREAEVKPVVERSPTRPRRRRAVQGAASWFSQVPNGYKLAAVLAVVLIVLVVKLSSFGGSDREYYETYTAIWNEHKRLRDSSASDEEWSGFAKEVQRQIEPIVHELERTAGSKRPIKQNLLWAGRDYLPLMVVDAREKPSEAEELFADHMEDARLLLAGKEPRPRGEEGGELDDPRPWEQGDFEGEGSGPPPQGGTTP